MEEIASKLIEIQMQLKFYHWQTTSYARHMAYGFAYDSMNDLIDTFVETLMGKYGRVPALPTKVYNRSEKSSHVFIEETKLYLLSFNSMLNPAADSDLLNIRDEMLQVFNKLNYLLTLK